MERNQGFENSLRCLQHPLSLLSIALLLLNDHVFKVISPSWLTGKLSDFAGLFFFPFIVAAGLSILLAGFNFKYHTIGKLAFGLITLWFFLLKTVPLINQASNFLISILYGHPVLLLIDASDTLALVALYPSWILWKQASDVKIQKASYMPLILGVFACLATSPAAPKLKLPHILW